MSREREYTVTLVSMCGDIEEFADLIGLSGKLRLSSDSGSFCCGGSGWLEFCRKRVTRKVNQIRVHTKLGNTFVFLIN